MSRWYRCYYSLQDWGVSPEPSYDCSAASPVLFSSDFYVGPRNCEAVHVAGTALALGSVAAVQLQWSLGFFVILFLPYD